LLISIFLLKWIEVLMLYDNANKFTLQIYIVFTKIVSIGSNSIWHFSFLTQNEFHQVETSSLHMFSNIGIIHTYVCQHLLYGQEYPITCK
jgi:hypothetical protein